MSKIAVVYWSGTGNTEAMANIIAAAAKETGAEVALHTAGDFSSNMVKNYDSLAFGCPSMGAEVLEDSEFEPMFLSCKDQLKGKKLALFGSYGWGDGEWMRNWEKDCTDSDLNLVADSLICHEAPDTDEKLAECKALGTALAKA